MFADGAPVMDRIYLDEEQGKLVERYWRYLLLSQNWGDAGKLAKNLRTPPDEPDTPTARQFVACVDALHERVIALKEDEATLDERLFELYDLTDQERALVEGG